MDELAVTGGTPAADGSESSPDAYVPALLANGPARQPIATRDRETGLTEAEQWENARECDRQEAARRLAALETWQAALQWVGGGRRKTAATSEFVRAWNASHPQAEQVCAATLYAWARLHRERGRAGLLPAYGTGERDQRVPKEVGDLVGRYYLDPNKRKLTVCYEIARVECARLHPHLLDQFPSIATLRRYIRRRWPRQAIILAREGESAFRQQALPYVEMDPTSWKVMELWTADHAVHDVWIANGEGRRIRPWTTDWRDKRTSLRVGWLAHEGPNADTILASFANACRRHGLPRVVQFDNGLDFSTPAFVKSSRRWRLNLHEPRIRALLEHLRCEVRFTIPRQPQGKGSHEVQYSADREWFDKLWETYCGKDPNSRPDHLRHIKRRADGLPTLVEFQFLHGLYCEWKNDQPSQASDLNGRSPRQAFEAADFVRRAVPEHELRLLLLKTSKPLTVGKNGVLIFDRHFWSETISHYFGRRIYLRYELDCIGRLYAFDLEDRYIDTLERVDLLRAGANQADARKARARKAYVQKLAKQANVLRQEVAANPDIIRALTSQRLAGALPPAPDPSPGGPGADRPERKVVEMVHTPFRVAAKAIKSDERRSAARAKGKRAAAKGPQLYPGPTGRPAPDPDAVRRENAELFERHRSNHG